MNRYNVELRPHTDDGDYHEEDYEFDDLKEAIAFARTNIIDFYALTDYGSEGKTYDPKDISHKLNTNRFR